MPIAESPRIRTELLQETSSRTTPSNVHSARLTASYSIALEGEVGALAWKQKGEELDSEELWQLAEKPIRSVLLRDKPSDWNRLAEYAAYLDEDVVFIYPG